MKLIFDDYKNRIDNILKELETDIRSDLKRYYQFDVGDILIDVKSKVKYEVLEIVIETNIYDFRIHSHLKNLLDGSIVSSIIIDKNLCSLKDYQERNENYVKCLERLI